MPATLLLRSAVIVGRDVNISILKPPWLLKHGILDEDELSSGDIVFTQLLMQVPTDCFDLLGTPDRLQVRLSSECQDPQAKVVRLIGGIVTTLPHTPFTALGFNFEYWLKPAEEADYPDWNRARFGTSFAVEASAEMPNARFGSFCSFDHFDMRVRVQLTPGRAKTEKNTETPKNEPPEEGMITRINFHRNLAQPFQPTEVLETLARWETMASFAADLTKSIETSADRH